MGNGGIITIQASWFFSQTFLDFKLTGMQGDVMKESMAVSKTLALSLVEKSEFKKLSKVFEETKMQGIHIHVPEGATPKDGPSAGVGMVTSIISAITEVPVNKNVAMTGEITLRGLVLPIGGLKEKLLAAHRAGIKKVLIPIEK